MSRNAAAWSVFGIGFAISCASPPAPSSETVLIVQEISSAYSVRVTFSFRHLDPRVSPNQIHASAPTAEGVDRYVQILHAEISELPREVFRCGEIRTIALVRNLTVGGSRRYAAPMREERTLVLDVGDATTPRDYLRWTFHHELFHLIDFSEDELVRHDPQWESLNPSGFTYGAGGDRVYHDPETAYRWTAPPPGFVTLYATMGAEEDKAETFAAMMTRAGDVGAPFDSETVFSRKSALLKTRLAQICPGAVFDWD